MDASDHLDRIKTLAEAIRPRPIPSASMPPPSDEEVSQWLALLRRLVFAEFLDPPAAASMDRFAKLLRRVEAELGSMLARASAWERSVPACGEAGGFLDALPEVARLARLDVAAAMDADPSVATTAEAVACLPGPRALLAHRAAHRLFRGGHRLIARLLAEAAHRETGIDIHPGASIGESCFIDHGTGVVIGETAVIGRRCRLYQGVTLGARSFPRDPAGRLVRGAKRHPTLEDDVVVYANATILGGDTVIGRGSEIAGGAFVTASVEEGHVAWTPRERATARRRSPGEA